LEINPSLFAEQAGFRIEARFIDDNLPSPIFIGHQ